MNPKLFPLLYALLVSVPAYGEVTGNMNSQEVGDVVFRRLDKIPKQAHNAIYVGQTDKEDSIPSIPFYHKVIEMAGVVNTNWGKVTEVKGIGFSNFQEFMVAHPVYYGAFTAYKPNVTDPLQMFISQGQRKLIFEAAQLLLNRGSEIKYVVTNGENMTQVLNNYFKAGVDEDGNNLVNYTGDPLQIVRMRCDSFVEYAYAYAGVPIAKTSGGVPVYLTTKAGASYLVGMAGIFSLYPSTQRDTWMVPSQTENPTLIVKDSNDVEVSGTASTTTLKFIMQDASSGPGLLKIHKDPIDSVYGMADFSFPIELMNKDTVLTGNINSEKTFTLSKADGLSPGYFQATAYDHAGNMSAGVSFTIPPKAGINIGSLGPLYNNFKGVSISVPSTLERGHTFTFSESVAGVSAVTIDGPQGNLVSWNFEPPVLSTGTVLYDLSNGTYTVTALNAVGEETATSFKISELNVQISTLESTQNYVHDDLLKPGTFYFTAHVIAESPNNLSRIQLITSTGALLTEKIVSGHTATADFDLPAFPLSQPLPNHTLFDRYIWMDASPPPYIARVIDSEGNVKDSSFALSGKETYLAEGGGYPDGIESYDYIRSTDVTKSDFIAGPLVMNYGISESTSGLVLGTGEGFGASWGSVSQWITQTPISISEQLAIPMPQTIGTFREIIRTRGSDGIAGGESVVAEGEVFIDRYDSNGTSEEWIRSHASCGTAALVLGYWPAAGFVVCTRQTVPTPILQPAKQFVEWEFIYNKTSDTTIPICGLIPDGTNLNYQCQRYGARVLNYSQTLILAGFALSQEPILSTASIPSGQNIFAPLNSYGEAYFDEVTSPGSLTVTATTSRPPAGFAEAAQNTTYEITPSPDLAFTGNVRLTLKYPSDNLTPAQENQLKLVKVVNPATGKYEQLAATLNPANKTISVTITSFSKFMVLAPEYPDPQATQSPDSINGFPEMDFLSGAAASLSKYDMGGSAGVGTLAALKSANKFPVGNVYSLSTATSTFEPSGAIKMRYSGGAVAGLGIDEDSLAIYGFTATGDLYKLPYLTLDKDNKVLTARVPSAAYPLFAVLASSQQVENTPPSVYPDGISPETAISFGGITVPVADGTFISSATAILFSASDPQVQSVVTSGVNLTNYILSPGSGTVEISTYTGPFTLPEGVHPMYYMSVDNAGNYEFPKATTMYIDATPPETELSATLMTLAPDTSFYATISGTITLSAADPLVRGAQSGVLKTFYLVEKNFSECLNLAPFLLNPSGQLPTFTGPPGTCENPLYTASFTLSPGTHTVQYLSLDNIRNMESPKTFHLEVARDTAPPMCKGNNKDTHKRVLRT